MERLRKLRGERAKLVTKAKDLVAAAAKADRSLSEEESTEIDEITAKVEGIDKEIKTLEAVTELERTAPAQKTEIIGDGAGDGKPSSESKGLPEITGGHERILDDPYRGFRKPEAGGLTEFFYAVIQAGKQQTDVPIYRSGKRETRLRSLASDLSAAAGADEQHGESNRYGNFTVPIGFTARLLMLEMENDPTAGVTTIPMENPTVEIPARVDKNHTSSVAGGITASWRPQTTAISSSRIEVERISLTARSLAAIAYVTEELLNDSPLSWAALLDAAFRDAITDAIIRARISGTGAGEPMGILNSPCLVSVDTTGQTTGTLTAANILGMRKRCWRYSQAVWIANHDIYEVLAGIHVAGTNSDSFLFNPARGIDVPDTLLGRPIIFSEYASSLNTIGDIMLCVWSQYLVGTLQGPQMAESMHVRFENNERALRATIRQAGEPWWRSALTPVNGANTLSPFVALATRTT